MESSFSETTNLQQIQDFHFILVYKTWIASQWNSSKRSKAESLASACLQGQEEMHRGWVGKGRRQGRDHHSPTLQDVVQSTRWGCPWWNPYSSSFCSPHLCRRKHWLSLWLYMGVRTLTPERHPNLRPGHLLRANLFTFL